MLIAEPPSFQKIAEPPQKKIKKKNQMLSRWLTPVALIATQTHVRIGPGWISIFCMLSVSQRDHRSPPKATGD